MNTRTIFIIAATLALAASVWMALTSKAEATPSTPATAEIIPGIPDAPPADLVTPARPEAHASVRVTIPAATDPPPRPARAVPRDAGFVQLDRPIIGTIDGRRTIIEPGYYRIFKPGNQKKEF